MDVKPEPINVITDVSDEDSSEDEGVMYPVRPSLSDLPDDKLPLQTSTSTCAHCQ